MGTETFNFVSVLLAVAGLAGAIYGLIHTKRSYTASQNESLASIYHKFSEGNVRDARTYVWIDVIPNWFSDKLYRSKVTYYSEERFSLEKYANHSMSDDQKLNEFREYHVSDLVDFYSYLYRLLHNDQKLLKEACNQYFYHWWRGFLLSYVLLSYKIWEEKCPTHEAKQRLPFHNNLELILRLDIEAMECPFDPDKDIFYSKYIREADLYPGLEEHNYKLMQHHGCGLFLR